MTAPELPHFGAIEGTTDAIAEARAALREAGVTDDA